MAENDINYFAHLDELRNRLLWILGAISVFTIGSFIFSGSLMGIVTAPIRKSMESLYFLTPYEAFLTRLKVSLTTGLILSAPVIFTQFWQFVSPGLYPSEKRAVVPITIISTALFTLGVTFAYFLVVPFALRFFLGFQTETLRPLISIGSYVSFFLSLLSCRQA